MKNRFSIQSHEDFLEDDRINWLGHHFVDIVVPRLLNIGILDMARTGNNHGLRRPAVFKILPYFLGELVSVHDRHAYISKNKAVGVRAGRNRLANHLEGVLAVIGAVY